MSEDLSMDRVYIVTSGEYSSYGIDSVWTTREAAELHAGTWGEVEEWLLNTSTERTIIQWRAWIDQRNEEIRIADRASETSQPGHTHVERVATGPYRYRGEGNTADWTGDGFGPTPEHARKALSDALAKAKAEHLEQGPKPTESDL